MANVTPAGYKITAGDVLLAATGLAIALALTWISLDLLAGGRLTLAVTRRPGPVLHVIGGDDNDDETATGG